MKLKLFIVGLGMSLCSVVFAANEHVHPDAQKRANTPASGMTWPSYCEIEIVNRSLDDVTVSGIFDDGIPLQSFNVYSFEQPHYISLYYYGYCHAGMDLDIHTFYGDYIYSGYTPVGRTIRIVSYLGKQAKAEVVAKS